MDDAFGFDARFFLDEFQRAFQRDGIRIVVVAQGNVFRTVLHVGAEAPDIGADLVAVGSAAQMSGQVEQLEGFVECDAVHFLARPQAGETGFFLVLAGADLHIGPVAAHTHADRLAALRIGAEFAGLHGLLARDRAGTLVEQFVEGFPEFAHDWDPVLFTARYLVELVFQAGGEVVVDVLAEVLGQEAVHHAADVGRGEAPAFEFDVLACE